MTAVDCTAFGDLAPELALGTLPGGDRAAALDHLATCHPCARDLDALTRTLDAVLTASPVAEPPDGFAARVMDGFPASTPVAETPSARRGRSRRPRRAPAAVAAAMAAAVLLLIGGGLVAASVLRGRGPAAPAAPASPSAAAPLRNPGGVTVGRVVVERGERSRLVVSLDPGTPTGTYRVQCDYESGGPYAAGTLVTDADGRAHWAATVTVPTYDLRRVRLVSTGRAPNLEADLTAS